MILCLKWLTACVLNKETCKTKSVNTLYVVTWIVKPGKLFNLDTELPAERIQEENYDDRGEKREDEVDACHSVPLPVGNVIISAVSVICA